MTTHRPILFRKKNGDIVPIILSITEGENGGLKIAACYIPTLDCADTQDVVQRNLKANTAETLFAISLAIQVEAKEVEIATFSQTAIEKRVNRWGGRDAD